MTKSAARKPKDNSSSNFGEMVEGIEFPVFNERVIRASAGLLFLFGFSGWMIAATVGVYQPLRAFGMAFMFDMFLRLFIGAKWVPSLILANLVVRSQRPEWVDAEPKKLAWTIGFVMVTVSCMSMGLFALTGVLPLILCGVCLSFLFLESAFGICIGCEIAMRFSKTKPRLCPGDVCNYVPPKR